MNGAAYEEVRLLLEANKYPPQVIGALRAEVRAERDAEIIAWLGKKASEYGNSNRENRAKAEAVGRMADKLSRGAVRDQGGTAQQGEKDTREGESTSPAEQIIYRAGYQGEYIPLGLYTTQAAARAHCEAQLSSEYPAHVTVVHDWIGDEDDPMEPWELVAEIDDAEEQPTGYVVTPLIVAHEYDAEADS